MPQSKMWQTFSSGNFGLGEGPLADFMGVLAWMVGCLMVFVRVVTWTPVLHRIPLSQLSVQNLGSSVTCSGPWVFCVVLHAAFTDDVLAALQAKVPASVGFSTFDGLLIIHFDVHQVNVSVITPGFDASCLPHLDPCQLCLTKGIWLTCTLCLSRVATHLIACCHSQWKHTKTYKSATSRSIHQ